jgi:hypothetical protein
MQYRNPVWKNSTKTLIGVSKVLSETQNGPLVYLNEEDIIVEQSHPLFDRIASGEFGEVADFVRPPAQVVLVPHEVTLAQARTALMQAGLFDTVNSFIQNSNNPLAKMAWEYTNMVARDGALVTALAPAIGFTEAQLDQLFIAAAAIKL